MTERKVLERWQAKFVQTSYAALSPHGHGERRFSTRPFARIFYLTISLLLAFLANCEKPVPLSPPGAPPTPPKIVEFDTLNKERTKLELFRVETENAKKSNSINESEYKEGIKKYEQRMRKNKEASEKLNLEN
jgi:hypothetical protein